MSALCHVWTAPSWQELSSRLQHWSVQLMKLCDLEGYKRLNDFLKSSARDSVCPAICMTEGCDYTTEMEPDQDAGHCEACGGNTVTSALVLAGLI
jgi:hypothetical protein